MTVYSKNGIITFTEFKLWLQNNPRVMETFVASFLFMMKLD